MKYVDEYRDAASARQLAERIRRIVTRPWSMMEVFMLGILVSVVKLAGMAKIVPGISLFAFLALIFTLAATAASLDPHLIWDQVEIES